MCQGCNDMAEYEREVDKVLAGLLVTQFATPIDDSVLWSPGVNPHGSAVVIR